MLYVLIQILPLMSTFCLSLWRTDLESAGVWLDYCLVKAILSLRQNNAVETRLSWSVLVQGRTNFREYRGILLTPFFDNGVYWNSFKSLWLLPRKKCTGFYRHFQEVHIVSEAHLLSLDLENKNKQANKLIPKSG